MDRWMWCLLLFSCSCLAQVRVSYQGLPGIGLISGEPEVAQALGREIDAKAIDALGPVLPYSVLLENQTSRNLMQISVRAVLTNQDGTTRKTNIVYGRSGYPVSWVARQGATILVTPVDGSLTITLEKGMTIPEAPELNQLLRNRVAKLSHVQITLDSVVFDDGEVIGPDELGALIRINAMNAADASVAQASQKQELESITEPAELYTRAATPTRANTSEEQMFQAIYDEQRWHFAQLVLRLPKDRLPRFVENIQTHPYPTAWRKP